MKNKPGRKYSNKKEFMNKSMKVHGDTYIYDYVIYTHVKELVTIVCKKHGNFSITPSNHLLGSGCPECFQERNRSNIITFVTKANNVHSNVYTYSNAIYINSKTKLTITCSKHGDFEQQPNNHIAGQGCPMCKKSKGELKVIKYLENKSIKYISEYILVGSMKRYDFYLPELNILIEYDGIQHFKKTGFSNNEDKLKRTIASDIEKTKLAKLNNIPLVRIPYTKYSELDRYLELEISKIYKYKVNGIYYKTFLEMCSKLNLPKDTTIRNYKNMISNSK